MPLNDQFPLLSAALEHHAARLQVLKSQLEQIEDADEEEDLPYEFECTFEITHSEVETPQSIAQLEARIGMQVPELLKALWMSAGGFQFLYEGRWDHIDLPTIDGLLSWCNNQNVDEAWPSLLGALHTFGSREEFSGLPPAWQEVLSKEYTVFGWTHHNSGVDSRVLLVFDARGQFYNVPYEHDCSEEDWVARYQSLARKTQPGIGLDEMLAAYVAHGTRRMQTLFDEGEYEG